MLVYGPRPQKPCHHHLPWHWQDIKEGMSHIYQECERCGWKRLMRYAGSPKSSEPEDASWLLPAAPIVSTPRARRVLVLTGYGSIGQGLTKKNLQRDLALRSSSLELS